MIQGNAIDGDAQRLLDRECLGFITALHRQFDARRRELLAKRKRIQYDVVCGGFAVGQEPTTAEIRNGGWRVSAPIPDALASRKVDIVCLDVSSKTVLKECLGSGADGIQVDFDDGYSPSLANNIAAHQNLYDLLHREEDGASFNLSKAAPLLIVRPRSLNLDELHLLVDGEPVAGAFYDLAIHLYWNARVLFDAGKGPYFYIPKLENYSEAALWNDVLVFCEERLGFPLGSIKVIVLIENILAAFHMEEIIYFLRNHIVALNTGRWDYIFSFIKKFSESPAHTLPPKSSLSLDQPFLQAYYRLLVAVSHRRGIMATGGMAPQVPQSGAALNDKEQLTVYNGKRVEAQMGFDGALVAHVSAVPLCRRAFDETIGKNRPNTLQSQTMTSYSPLDARKYIDDLTAVPVGSAPEEKDVYQCLDALYRYIYSWLVGKGALPLNGVVEDLASIEINRALLWKWIKSATILKEGGHISVLMILNHLNQIQQHTLSSIPATFHPLIQSSIHILLFSQDFVDFMPTVLYPPLIRDSIRPKSKL